MPCNSSHLRTSFMNFSSISEGKKQAALVANKHSKCSAGDVRLFTLSEPSRFRPVRTRSVASNIFAQQRRRNGTETWRRPSCRCEHLRLITHEKILLNGDVPRRNGSVTYIVNQLLLYTNRLGVILVPGGYCYFSETLLVFFTFYQKTSVYLESKRLYRLPRNTVKINITWRVL